MRPFRKTTPRLAPAAARRQGDITKLAITLLGREAAISFMNGDNTALGGRPIDLVIASDEGRALVESELSRSISGNAEPGIDQH